jgi:hypothetical protein
MHNKQMLAISARHLLMLITHALYRTFPKLLLCNTSRTASKTADMQCRQMSFLGNVLVRAGHHLTISLYVESPLQ